MMRNIKVLTFRQKVERIYYNYGKFAASHPKLMLTGAILMILIAWYPLPNAFVHGNAPYEQTRIKVESIEARDEDDKRFIGYVQQLVIENLAVTNDDEAKFFIEMVYEALSECFNIVHIIKKSHLFEDHCYTAKRLMPKSKEESLFPTYSCMLLSPSQLWNESSDNFWADGNILKTINQKNVFIREMLFGLPWAKTGLRQLYKIDSSYQINYVITFLLEKYDKKKMETLLSSLRSKYKMSIFEPSDSAEQITYKDWTYFETHFNLLMTYLMLILYVYFSVRKIELVKSKIGLAFSACFTVAASLYMSLGICIYIGIVAPTLPGSEIFPYLVVIIGLENTLVVTKSVVATPVDLPVKHRIAQGLEKEGWAITKNLVSEILIFSLGIFTFNPAIQEFFMLALISLSVDFFLQITFFVTVLSIDMRRIELSDIKDMQQNRLLTTLNSTISSSSLSQSSMLPGASSSGSLDHYSKENISLLTLKWIGRKLYRVYTWLLIDDSDFGGGVPGTGNANVVSIGTGNAATGIITGGSGGGDSGSTNVKSNSPSTTIKRHKRRASDINTAAFMKSDGTVPVYIPRRLIFLYFWAKSRFFQKLVMITACAWIAAIILYSIHNQDNKNSNSTQSSPWKQFHNLINPHDDQHLSTIDWKLAAMHHWPRLANLYSINITGKSLIVLPTHRIIHRLPISGSKQNEWKYSKTINHTSNSKSRFQWLPRASMNVDQLMVLPSSLRGGWANLRLTVKMVLASIIGVGIVLMSTVLVMTLLQALQLLWGGDSKREPILRIMPRKIDSVFSVPPGVTCLSVEYPLVLAAGLQIESPENVVSLVKCWNLDTGELCDSVPRCGVWSMLFIQDSSRVLVSMSDGSMELWRIDQVRDDSRRAGPSSFKIHHEDSVQLDEGGIVKMKVWRGCEVIGTSVRGSVLIFEICEDDTNMTMVPANKIVVKQINRLCPAETIKEFNLSHFGSLERIVVQTHKTVTVASLPELVIISHYEFDFLTVLSSHLSQNILLLSLNNNEFHLFDFSHSSTLNKFHWTHTSPIHWIRCFNQPISDEVVDNLSIKRNTKKSSVTSKRPVLVTFDMEGCICLWREKSKYPFRQIIIASPSLIYPGPISVLDNGSNIIFADHGYLRLFNVHTNKYERSIQILGLRDVDINEIVISKSRSSHKSIVFLNSKREIYILPISTVL